MEYIWGACNLPPPTMPVTFNVSTHPANPIKSGGDHTAKDILAAACDDQYRKAEEILQFGFSESCGESE